jgi:tight adherence protein C
VTLLIPGSIVSAMGAVFNLVGELGGARGTRASLARVAGYGRTPLATERAEAAPPGRRRAGTLVRIARLAPGREKSAATLAAAGITRIRPELFSAGKLLAGFVGFLLGIALAVTGSGAGGVLFALVAACAGFVLPEFVVGSRARRRREQAFAELPNALDLLAVTVEAGLGLDAALARFAETADGPLAQELALLVTELRVGGSRAEAFRRFAERLDAPETKAFVRAIVHADQLGVSLAGTLRSQAAESRFRRQAIVEEKANKAPVKMLFPTVLCIFPALFVVLLGPPMMSLGSVL